MMPLLLLFVQSCSDALNRAINHLSAGSKSFSELTRLSHKPKGAARFEDFRSVCVGSDLHH